MTTIEEANMEFTPEQAKSAAAAAGIDLEAERYDLRP